MSDLNGVDWQDFIWIILINPNREHPANITGPRIVKTQTIKKEHNSHSHNPYPTTQTNPSPHPTTSPQSSQIPFEKINKNRKEENHI